MADYRFVLEPYKSHRSRYRCPSCGERKSFTRYIDLASNEYISNEVGKCDRLMKCGYHYPPREFFQDNNDQKLVSATPVKPAVPLVLSQHKKNPISYIDQALLRQSLRSGTNNFLAFLSGFVTEEKTEELRRDYHLGTWNSRKAWDGAAIFWQVDEHNRIRTGKVMQYDKISGKKKRVNWVHSLIGVKHFNLNQCLFGLHLLNTDRKKSIAIVESEKTAVIASVAFPQFIWMATGGLLNLNFSRLAPLENRHVILFPDAGCYQIWEKRISELPENIKYSISERVEKEASLIEKTNGCDLADYILKIWKRRRDN